MRPDPRHPLLGAALVAAVLVAPPEAVAGDALSMSAVNQVTHGEQTPSVSFEPTVSGRLAVSLTCADRTWQHTWTLSPGRTVTLSLEGFPEGTHRCEGTARLEASDGSWGEMPLGFEVSSLGLLGLSAGMGDLDLAKGTLTVHATRPVAAAKVTVRGLQGPHHVELPGDLSDPTTPRFTWPVDGVEVLVLDVVARDASGFVSSLELMPWSYEIPHEDVVFASGQAEVRAAEEPKLAASWADVQATVAKYGEVVPIGLYVAGFTDTVGEASANRALSARRARSIAAWFRAQGFEGEVWYQGFGEDVLAVDTPDGTDEPRNRRALYLLAAQQPPVGEALPRDAWKKLP